MQTSFCLVALLVASAAGSGLECTLLKGGLDFLKAGLNTQFDKFCVPEIQPEVAACKSGQLAAQAAQMALTICTDLGNYAGNEIKSLNFIPYHDKLAAAFLPPNGFVFEQCKTDLTEQLVSQITQECQQIGNINPQQFCDSNFNQLYQKLEAAILSDFKCASASTSVADGGSCFLYTLLGFIRPGVNSEFDQQCVPQITAQVEPCKDGSLVKEVGQMAAQLCQQVGSSVSALIAKVPFLAKFLKPSMFQPPNGFVYTNCVTDLTAALKKQVEEQCGPLKQIDPKSFCDQAFGEIFCSLETAVGQKICKAAPANCNQS